MATEVVPSQLQALFDALSLIQKQNYSLIAAITLLLCDIASTFASEIQYIWKARWSFPKFIYILGRYYGLVYLIIQISVSVNYHVSLPACKGYYWYWILSGDILFTTIVNLIFSLRMYALYDRKRWVLIFFILVCIGEYGAEFYISYTTASISAKTTFLPPAGVPIPGCLAGNPPLKITLAAWIPNILVNTLFFVASFTKLRHIMKGNTLLSSKKGTSPDRPTLMTICVRDGAFFYFLTISIVTINMVATLAKNGQYYEATSPWLITVYSLVGAHLILNLRTAGNSDSGFTIDTTTNAPDPMRFQRRPAGRNIASSIVGSGTIAWV